MKKDVVNVRFPVGGVTRRTAIQSQSPFVCYDALNVFPDCVFLERERGGHRPGMKRAHSGPGGGSVNHIGELGYIDGSGDIERELLIVAGGAMQAIRKSDGSVNAITGSLNTGRMLTGAAMLGKYYIARGADANESLMVYDPSLGTVAAVTATAGTVPIKSKICINWRDRIVLADGENPNEIWMSRQGDPNDWDTSATDVGRALVLSATQAGLVGQPVRALIPHTENCLLIATDSEWYVLRSDPTAGGRVILLTDVLGILGRRAWCHSPDGYLWTMTNDGLYVMPPGCGDPLYSVSREKLPAELVNYNPDEYTVSMAYCKRTRAVFVFMTELAASQTTINPPFCGTVQQGSEAPSGSTIKVTHYCVDIRNTQSNDMTNKFAASFWPMGLDEDDEPTFAHSGHTVDDEPAAYFGTRGSGVCYFDRRAGTATVPDQVPVDLDQDQGGGAFHSYIMFGPFSAGQIGRAGMLARINATLSNDSRPVEYEIFAGDDAESPLYEDPVWSGEWTLSGLNYPEDVRIRGKYFWVLIRSKDKEPWAFENMQLTRHHSKGLDRKHFDDVQYGG